MENLKKEIVCLLLSNPEFWKLIDQYIGGGCWIYDPNDEKNWPFIDGEDDAPGNILLKISRVKKAVCPECDGRGTELSGGLKGAVFYPEDFERDPEFAERYFGGAYDVACSRCKGNNVIDVPDLEFVKDERKLKYIREVIYREIEEKAISEMEARGEAMWQC